MLFLMRKVSLRFLLVVSLILRQTELNQAFHDTDTHGSLARNVWARLRVYTYLYVGASEYRTSCACSSRSTLCFFRMIGITVSNASDVVYQAGNRVVRTTTIVPLHRMPLRSRPVPCSLRFTSSLNTAAVVPPPERGVSSVGQSVQFIEIYNDKIRDLLHPGADSSAFRVREHPQTGPYVDNLVPVQVRLLQGVAGQNVCLCWSLVETFCVSKRQPPVWNVVGAAAAVVYLCTKHRFH